ncbi:MAG: acyltransferase [Clostridiales bacterium]|nr:acyltransferase [Clostridiales bacterium]
MLGWNKLNWKDRDLSVKYIDVLDGVRAFCVLIIVWFHFWQQTWLMPVYPTPFLSWLGIEQIDPNLLRRVGYLFVDALMLLSAFLLFLPYARSMFLGEPEPSVKSFYKRRVARIVPSYVLCILIMLVIALVQGNYHGDWKFMLKDVFTHLTFTHMFFPDTYIFSQLNGALWVIAIEVQFYLVLPWLAKLFKKYHLLVLSGVMAVGLGFIYGFGSAWIRAGEAGLDRPIAMIYNQFPTFLPVFAIGMGCACLYVLYVKHCKWKRALGLPMAAVAIFALTLIWSMMEACMRAPNVQVWQMMYRLPLAGVFALFMLSLALAAKPLQVFFGNPITKWLAAISYNLFIWHQMLLVWMRQSFGFGSGGDVATAGPHMQWILTVLGLIVSLFIAWLATTLVEKPMANLILRARARARAPQKPKDLPTDRFLHVVLAASASQSAKEGDCGQAQSVAVPESSL